MSRFASVVLLALLFLSACSIEGVAPSQPPVRSPQPPPAQPPPPPPPPPARVPTQIVLSSIANPVAVGGSYELTARVNDQNGIEIRDASPSWSSSDTQIATVEAGLVEVVATGKAVITAAYEGVSAESDLVTFPEIIARVTVDEEPAPGFTVRVGPLFMREAVTDSLGAFRFVNRREGGEAVDIFGDGLSYDILQYGFQVNSQRVNLENGVVTEVEFRGFSIPQCDTVHQLIKLEFINNDPVYDDYWRSAVCRWTNIVSSISWKECFLRAYDGVVVQVEYVDTREEEPGRIGFCEGSPLFAYFQMSRSSLYDDPKYWLVPPQAYGDASDGIASALGIMARRMPEWEQLIEQGDPVLFTGVEATREFQAFGGTGSPRVFAWPGWAKWRDDELCNEAMGSQSWAGTTQPISAVTVAAIEDAGVYEVNRDAAEPFIPYDCPAGSDAANVGRDLSVAVTHE